MSITPPEAKPEYSRARRLSRATATPDDRSDRGLPEAQPKGCTGRDDAEISTPSHDQERTVRLLTHAPGDRPIRRRLTLDWLGARVVPPQPPVPCGGAALVS
jgi:hypothetical protein